MVCAGLIKFLGFLIGLAYVPTAVMSAMIADAMLGSDAAMDQSLSGAPGALTDHRADISFGNHRGLARLPMVALVRKLSA